MQEQYYGRPKKKKSKSGLRIFIFLFLMAIIVALGLFSMSQNLALQLMRDDLESLQNELNLVREENNTLQEQYEQIHEENEELREENHMLRSTTVINHGNRETNKVAITIDDGAGPELINQTLDYLKEYDVRATLFPMGWWVEQNPEVWRRAVEEGHELGNHTYSHAFLTTISEEQIRAELNGWQDSVDQALGYSYKTLYFRPPGMDGFAAGQANAARQIKEIIAGKGMFAVLWDVELVYALRNEVSTPARITEHVLSNARGGSIVLLHFTPNDITALPSILEGLRRNGLEPCSLRELLLADPQA